MITFERTSAASNGLPGDDLDGLLQGFFQAEMPDPWPEFSPPRRLTLSSARTESTARPNRWLLKSRLLLVAASVALFLGAQFLLPNFMPSSTEKSGHVGDVSNPFAKDPNKDLIKSEAEIEKKLTIQIDDDGAFFKSEANFKDPGKK